MFPVTSTRKGVITSANAVQGSCTSGGRRAMSHHDRSVWSAADDRDERLGGSAGAHLDGDEARVRPMLDAAGAVPGPGVLVVAALGAGRVRRRR